MVWVVTGGGAFILFLLGVVWRVVDGKIASTAKDVTKVQDDLHGFKVEVAKTYPSREALKDMLEPIMDELRKIDATQQRLFERIDSKADK